MFLGVYMCCNYLPNQLVKSCKDHIDEWWRPTKLVEDILSTTTTTKFENISDQVHQKIAVKLYVQYRKQYKKSSLKESNISILLLSIYAMTMKVET